MATMGLLPHLRGCGKMAQLLQKMDEEEDLFELIGLLLRVSQLSSTSI